MSLINQADRSRPRIWAIGISRLSDLYQGIVEHYEARADIRLLTLGYDAAVEAIRNAAPGQLDVVVAAGSNGAYLRSRVDVPVVLVNVTGFDVMDALTRARRAAPAIALVTYGDPPVELARFTAAFGIALAHRVYRNAQDAHDCVLDLKQSGIGAIAGPGLVTDLAEREGLRGVFLYSHASVNAAFETALEVARGGRVEAHKRARLDIIFSHLREGVLTVGPGGQIETLNARMAEICEVDAVGAIGKPVHQVIAQLPRDLLDASHELADLVHTIGRKSYVIERIALRERGIQTGWLLTAQESQTLQRIDRSLRSRHRPAHLVARYQLADLLGEAEPMRRLREVATRYARSDATVLINGESGTGKELVAQGMHNQSARQAFAFVAVNCGAFPENLLESELFGYEEGAFTGARRGGKPGLIESAHGGTLFLDEIAEMPPQLQTRLLRVLQEREVVRLGANQPVPVDIRVIAATHRNLDQLLEQGHLREDLYYRLNILRIAVPALRERLADLPVLLSGLLTRAMARVGATEPVAQLAEAMLPHCSRYDWPGNVRELENIVERMVIFYTAAASELPRIAPSQALQEVAPELFSKAQAAPAGTSLKSSGRGRERNVIRAMLAQCNGDQQEVCRRLGISRSTLWRRMREVS